MSDGAALFAAFDRLRRADGRAQAVLDTASGAALDRDALLRLVDRAAATIAATPWPAAGPIPLQTSDGAELIAGVLACWREGRVPLPLDAELAAPEARDCCARLGAPGLLRGPGLAFAALPQAEPGATPATLASGTALLKLTSGTTGEPRAVALSASALRAGIAQIASTMGITGRDRNLAAIPLAHSYGFDNVVLALAVLGTPAILVRDLTPRHLLRTARRTRATVLPTVPFLLDVLARSAAAAGSLGADLRLVITAGAPLPRATREAFAARFGVRPHTFYGATECGGIAFDREATQETPEGCVGTPLDGVTIVLRDAQDGVGRVEVRSASVATGYLPPAALGPSDAATLGEGAFLTPDLGRLDERGRLHLLGRASEVINVGGRKVFPAEVERVIRAVSGVRDVVVLGEARSAVAEALRAVVVADPGVGRDAVIAACEAHLARYKVPRIVELRDALPRTARGKLDRRRL